MATCTPVSAEPQTCAAANAESKTPNAGSWSARATMDNSCLRAHVPQRQSHCQVVKLSARLAQALSQGNAQLHVFLDSSAARGGTRTGVGTINRM